MAEVINLRRARKRRQREAAAAQAAANRAKFGRTPAEKARDADVLEEERRRLDQRRLEPRDDD